MLEKANTGPLYCGLWMRKQNCSGAMDYFTCLANTAMNKPTLETKAMLESQQCGFLCGSSFWKSHHSSFCNFKYLLHLKLITVGYKLLMFICCGSKMLMWFWCLNSSGSEFILKIGLKVLWLPFSFVCLLGLEFLCVSVSLLVSATWIVKVSKGHNRWK